MDKTTFATFEDWLRANLPGEPLVLEPLPGDASFRRYFRLLQHPGWLAVYAPPQQEKTLEFVQIAKAYEALGLNVPQILAYNAVLGFLIVSDLGPVSYLDQLQQDATLADNLYRDAIRSLVRITQAPLAEAAIGAFDAQMMLTELMNFTEWFLERYLGLALSAHEQALLDDVYTRLVNRACAQKQVAIHRDYHSRNLIYCPEHKNPGIIDFQDAMSGPITYDAASLLRDAYIAWTDDQVKDWAMTFYTGLKTAHPDYTVSETVFWDDFNWMGMQRHLKAIFIFARKYLRDDNPRYLGDIPRALHYVFAIAQQYPELQSFATWLKQQLAQKPQGQALLSTGVSS